jgi:phosphomannomutase
MRVSDLKISISGIRGIVGQSLTPQLLTKFSEAFSSYLGGGEIAVASDTRPSAEMVRFAVMAGLLSCGAEPVDLGVLPIPSLQIYTREHNLKGAVSITASHNPVEWNALKLIKQGGFFLNPYEAEELLDYYYQGRFRRVSRPESIRTEADPFAVHARKILDACDVETIRNRRPKVVIDPCAGASTPYVQTFLEGLGAEVTCINCRLGAGFPRNPEPVAANLGGLCQAVLREKADIGFAQDADADRLAVVDEQGRAIGEEYTLALAVDFFLREKQKSPVVVNLSTTRVIDHIARQAGVEVHRTRVGEINVSRKMQELGARIGGEGNGGIILADVHLCRDSFSGMALILEYLSRSGETVSRLRDRLPDYIMLKDKVKASFRDRKRILDRLSRRFGEGDADRRDGLRIVYPDFWFHVRPSNTEPVMRMQVEAEDEARARDMFREIESLINQSRSV